MRLQFVACLFLVSALGAKAQTIVYDPHPQPAQTSWTRAPSAASMTDAPSFSWKRAPQPGSPATAPEGWGATGVAPVDIDGEGRMLRLTGTPKVKVGRLRAGDVILSVPVAFSMTARLAAPLDRWGGPLSFIKPEPVGTAMYAVPMGRKWLWCMPRSPTQIWDANCYIHFAGLYRTSTISPGLGRLQWSEGGSAVRDLTVELGPADLPTLELQYRLRKVERRYLSVELRLIGGGQDISGGDLLPPRQADGSATMTALGGEIVLRPSGDVLEVVVTTAPRAEGDAPAIEFSPNLFTRGMVFAVQPPRMTSEAR